MIKNLILLFLLTTSCKSQNIDLNNKDKDIMCLIIFADGFKENYIDLSVNAKKVLKNAYLNSDKSDGLTNTWVRIIQKNRTHYISTSQEEKLEIIDLKTNEINLTFVYNGITKVFKLIKDDGSFLIISDDGTNKLIFNQTKNRPVFD